MRKLLTISATVALTAALAPAAQAQNIIHDHWTLISSAGGPAGTLRDATWQAGSTPASQVAMVDNAFQPEGTQWNNGSWWWDETVTAASPYYTTITLNAAYTFDHLVMQADDNENYLVEYWNGTDWQSVWTAAAVNTYGLVTRDSGLLPAFTTDQFRLSAFGGDKYYGISEFQGFGAVPEASTWALMMLGFGAVGGALRRRSAKVAFA